MTVATEPELAAARALTQSRTAVLPIPYVTRYIALDVHAETFSRPSADRDSAIESLYEQMGYKGTDDRYTATIVILEAVGTPAPIRALDNITFGAAYTRLQHYRPDPVAKRRDAQAADIDESERLH